VAEPYALSLKQPWAALLVHGLKTVEVRSWATRRRGRILIHAAGIPDKRPEAWARVPPALRDTAEQRRGIVGAAELVGVRRYGTPQEFNADGALHLNEPSWFRPPRLYGFTFANAEALPFRPCRGRTRFFRVADVPPADPLPPTPRISCASPPRLLVSVRDAAEAEAALAGGAALLDVKEPARGPLGRADDAAIAAVVRVVDGRVPVSAALGECCDPGAQDWPSALVGLSYLKWGLAECGGLYAWQPLVRAIADNLEARHPTARVVAVAYADWRRARAPVPEEVCAFAAAGGAGAFLLDTWGKDGSTLLNWANADDVAGWCARCRAAGIPVAVAGSLGEEQIRALLPAGPDWFAVRRAACTADSRTSAIDPARVRRLVDLLAGAVTTPPRGS
jgi:uncharacterized protein (UPF0264 family)